MLALPSRPRKPFLLERDGELAPGSEWTASSASSGSGSDDESAALASISAARSSIVGGGSREAQARPIPPELRGGPCVHAPTCRRGGIGARGG